ncbi:endonuclease III, partial [Staphylococcus agnetis]|nr:endonuclease III [Staphylococcus agnetis]
LARKPKCGECPLFNDCREGQKRYKASLRAVGGVS